MTSVNVSCGVLNSIFLWHITFTIPHFTPIRRITFFISFRKRNIYWDAFFVWFISVCSLITVLDDYFSISYLSIFIRAPAALCAVLPLYGLFDILRGKPPNEHKETHCFWGSFSYYSYRKTHKLYVLYISAYRDLIRLVNPTCVFVSINSLLKNLFLEIFSMGWENKLQ